MAFSAEDIRWMRSALSLSKRGLGRVWPNPSVGCIIVKNGIVLGRGVTAASGRPHAEAAALLQAGPAARGATAYVTLEPCAHPGRDHSCSDKLVEAGVSRVVAAITDPNPQVNGQGLAKLRAAGIIAECGLLEAEAADSHAGFFSRVTQNRPLVTLKLATSLDGMIATSSGESRWITGPEARRRVHLLRASHDAVLVGSGTVQADDPLLDVRDLGSGAKPVRVVFDTQLKTDLSSRLVRTARNFPLTIVHGPLADPLKTQSLTDAGANLLPSAPGDDGKLDLTAALAALAGYGLTRVLCEGGATLAAGLLKAGLVDRLVVFGAGKFIGNEGISAVGPLNLADLAQARPFHLRDWQRMGDDVMSVWSVTPAKS